MKFLNSLNDHLFGDTRRFAIQSGSSSLYSGRGQMALGFFVIHLDGICYGVLKPNATLLACSFDAVLERVARRGTHVAFFANEKSAQIVAQSFYSCRYGSKLENSQFFGLSTTDFSRILNQNQIQWAPDGDQAFDDGSFILHFDLGSHVRIIGFRVDENGTVDNGTLKDILLEEFDFYSVLNGWSSAFFAEWKSTLD